VILYYAMGGGLGHLVRARAFLHTFGLARRAALLTASHHARDPRVVGDLLVHLPPEAIGRDPSAVATWAAAAIADLAPDELVVDAFPAGLLGELRDLPAATNVTYVARLLNWSAYEPLARGLARRFSRTLILEELHPAHAAFVARASARVEPVALVDPPLRSQPLPDLPGHYTLVVHAGPDDELLELVSYARELAQREGTSQGEKEPIVVCRPGGAALVRAGALTVDVHPALSLVERATRVVTACGFNVMRQLAPFASKHHFLPLPRRYDDQYTRAARARRARGVTEDPSKRPRATRRNVRR
jgi:hypothetical protein